MNSTKLQVQVAGSLNFVMNVSDNKGWLCGDFSWKLIEDFKVECQDMHFVSTLFDIVVFHWVYIVDVV